MHTQSNKVGRDSKGGQVNGSKGAEVSALPGSVLSDFVIPSSVKLSAELKHLSAVSLIELAPSLTNPRKVFGDLSELTASIKRQGVLQPVVVRPFPAKRVAGGEKGFKYELVCGERRYRASKLAGLGMIPAMFVDLTDEEALEIQIVENGQRADIHPMEEAEAFEGLEELLRAKFKDPISEIAGRVGKTRAHVIRRMSLLGLPKNAREAFRKGLLPQETALIIARIPSDKLRGKAASQILANEHLHSANSARSYVEDNFMLDLSLASFDPTDAKLVSCAGACSACPKKTGNQAVLFGEFKEADMCLDQSCFSKKQEADFEKRSQAARADGSEILGKEESKALFSSGSNLIHGSDFVLPEAKNYSDPKSRTHRQLVGSHKPKGVLARDCLGGAVILWRKREVEQILKEHPTKEMEAVLANRDKQRESGREERRQAGIDKEVKKRIYARTLDTVSRGGKEEGFLRALVLALGDEDRCGYANSPEHAALSRSKFKSFRALFEKGSVVELRTFCLGCAVGDLSRSWRAQRAIVDIGAVLGVDGKTIAKETRTELDAKRQKKGGKSRAK